MSWTALPTYSDGNVLTAAQLNAIAANINETAAAKATAAGQHFVSTTANTLAARVADSLTVAPGTETTVSTSYTSLATAGPARTATTGVAALILLSSKMTMSANTAEMFAAFAVSSATTRASSDTDSISMQPATAAGNSIRVSAALFLTGLTAGSNVFTMQYRVTAGTGSYDRRHLAVIPW